MEPSNEEIVRPLFSSLPEEEEKHIQEEKRSSPPREDISPPQEEKKYSTLVLSGGGIKAFVLLGALQYYHDKHKFDLKTMIGTSIGSMICFLLAIGYTPIELLISLQMNKWLDDINATFNVLNILNDTGVVSWTKIQETLESLCINKIGYYPTMKDVFEKHNKHLVFVTYNFTKRTTEYLDYLSYPNLPCLVGIRMSCNIPLVFDKFKYLNNFYVDGGLGDNFAILNGDNLTKENELCLGICLKHKWEENRSSYFSSSESGVLDYVLALMQVPIASATSFRTSLVSKKCNVLEIDTEGQFDMSFVKFNVTSKERLDMFSLGYQTAKRES